MKNIFLFWNKKKQEYHTCLGCEWSLHDGQESHIITFIDGKWITGQTESSK